MGTPTHVTGHEAVAFGVDPSGCVVPLGDLKEVKRQEWSGLFVLHLGWDWFAAGDPIRLTPINEWRNAALAEMTLEQLEDGEWWASVEGVRGAWGYGKTPNEAFAELRDSLESWIGYKVEHKHTDIPRFTGVSMHFV